MPMVPVLAKTFDVGPLLTGVLASGLGLGMLGGSALMVLRDPPRRGLVYVTGSFGAMACLIVFAVLPIFPLAFVALVATGVFAAGFSSVQSALVMAVSPPEMRGRAMGLLSMAIGSLPFGMVMLGLLAERISPQGAVIVSAGSGMVALALWLVFRPEVTRIP
jgi:predicted MFS family arabinose efflux permease